MKNVMLLKLSPMQTDILRHRLEVPDCIADALTDKREDEQPYPFSREVVEAAVEYIEQQLTADGKLYLTPVQDRFGYQLMADILSDAVEGSVFYGAAIGNVSDLQLHNIGKAWQALADKIGKVLPITLEFPLY